MQLEIPAYDEIKHLRDSIARAQTDAANNADNIVQIWAQIEDDNQSTTSTAPRIHATGEEGPEQEGNTPPTPQPNLFLPYFTQKFNSSAGTIGAFLTIFEKSPLLCH